MWVIERREWDDPEGTALRAAQRAELDERYGSDDHEPGTPPSGADIDVFLVAVGADGRAAGCGAIRRLDDGTVEIKRMYVRPESRGKGASTAILRALEEAAGDGVIRLETGTAQPEAMRFYEREGYRKIPLFGAYVGSDLSVCYEKVSRR